MQHLEEAWRLRISEGLWEFTLKKIWKDSHFCNVGVITLLMFIPVVLVGHQMDRRSTYFQGKCLKSSEGDCGWLNIHINAMITCPFVSLWILLALTSSHSRENTLVTSSLTDLSAWASLHFIFEHCLLA